MKFKFILTLFYLFLFQIVTANSIRIGELNSAQNITSQVRYAISEEMPLLDETNNYSQYKGVKEDEIHLDYSIHPMWFFFKLENTLNKDLEFELFLTSGIIGTVELYAIENGKRTLILEHEQHYGTGLFPSFSLNLKPNEVKEYMIKRHGIHHFDVRVFIAPKDIKIELQSKYEKLYIFYLAVCFSMLFYNFFLFLLTKDRDFIVYCLFIFAISTTVMILSGYLENNLLNIPINYYLGSFSCLSLIATFSFFYSFLNIKRQLPKIVKFFVPVLSIAFLGLLINAFTPLYNFYPKLLGNIVDFNIILTISLIVMATVYLAIIKKDPLAKIYAASWFCMYIGIFIWFGVYFSILPQNFFTQNAIIFGNMFEMLVIAIGLGYKINILKAEKELLNHRAQDKEKYLKLLRVLSHDIANSLFVILNYAKKRSRASDSFNDEKAWERVLRSSLHIEQVLSSVKQEQAIEKDGQNLNLNDVDIMDAINQTILFFEEKLNEKHLKINIECLLDEDNRVIHSNKNFLINQIFSNILSNAIKYSPPGADINVKIFENNKKIVISFRDYGMGISESVVEKALRKENIFSTLGTQGEKGTGFGLYLVISYIELLKGDVHITNTGNGTLIELQFNKIT